MVMLSKSSLNTYIICPKLYKFLYIDRLERRTTSPEALRGTNVHEFCFNFYDNLIGSESKEFKINKQWLDEQLTLASENERPYLKNFVEFEEKRWKICVEQHPKNPELFFYPLLRERKIVNLGLEISGIIDRLDLNFDLKTYTVVDYKTEKFDQRPWKLTEHRREMAFYKMLVETSGLLKGEVTHFSIYYPRSNDVWAEKFSFRTINALREKMRDVREKITAGIFPTNISFFCRYCNANLICDFGS